jgi:hypothetical protein
VTVAGAEDGTSQVKRRMKSSAIWAVSRQPSSMVRAWRGGSWPRLVEAIPSGSFVVTCLSARA